MSLIERILSVVLQGFPNDKVILVILIVFFFVWPVIRPYGVIFDRPSTC